MCDYFFLVRVIGGISSRSDLKLAFEQTNENRADDLYENFDGWTVIGYIGLTRNMSSGYISPNEFVLS